MKKIKLTEYIIDNNVPEKLKGTSFVVLSDYHNNDFGIEPKNLIRTIDAANPEFIIFAGDIVTARPKYTNKRAYELIEALAKKYKIYYGNGNHEYRMRIYPENYGTMYEDFLSHINMDNIYHLVNESAYYEKDGARLKITGLEIDRRFYKRFKHEVMDKDYIESEIGKKEDVYTILIAHNPRYFKAYAEWGANLIFSGHVHGGLMRLPKVGGVLSPDIRFFPKYDYGTYEDGKSVMVVSSGAGAHTLKIRINNPAEVVVVSLK